MATPKVLVLGSTDHSRHVDSYRWDRLPPGLNIADYEKVILNFAALEGDDGLRHGMRLDRLPSSDDFARLIFSQGAEVIAIGDPSTLIGPSTEALPATWWLPAPEKMLAVTHANGDSAHPGYKWRFYFQDAAPQYRWYFEHLDRRASTRPRYGLQAVHPEADGLMVFAEAACTTRFHKAVGASFSFAALGPAGRYEPQIVATSGAAVWLPAPTTRSAAEAVDLVLTEYLEVVTEQPVPEWIDSFRLPREEAQNQALVSQELLLREAIRSYKEAQGKAEAEARYGKLLYETGDALERVVWDALGALGFDVEEPARKGRADGHARTPAGDLIVLEIKGRQGALALKDVRQLGEWVDDALAEGALHPKGVLIANVHALDAPSERPEPFPPNAIAFAHGRGLCLMTTTQLYEALRRDQLGELDREGLYREFIETVGVSTLAASPDP